MPESSEEVAAADLAARPAILLYAQSSFGGLAEHAHYQAQELADRGCPITVLCHRDFLRRPSQPRYRRRAVLLTVTGASRLAKLLRIAAAILDHYILAWWIIRTRPAVVLLDCASEYFMPFWVWPHLLLRRAGVHYLANFHDPVRTRHSGPHWLHRWSLHLMYRLLEGGLVHGPVPPEAEIPPAIRLIQAPLGLFAEALLIPPAVDVRKQFAIPEGSCVVLAFGHIADRKNLDLLIRAIALVPGMVLMIAGEHSSASQRPPAYYRQLAGELGIAGRVILCDEFIPDERIPDFFTAADIVALTYSSAFVSQSGVLQHAVAFRKPVLASCGPGPLRQTMEQFPLGALIPPDDVTAIAGGLDALRRGPPVPEAVFRAYEGVASWPANIDRLFELIGAVRTGARQR